MAGLDKAVTSIAAESNGRIWICTSGQGLWEYWQGQFISHANDPVMPPDKWVTTVHVDTSDRVWLGLHNQGIALRPAPNASGQAGAFQIVPGRGLILPQVNQIAEAPQGTLWFATALGLYRYRDGRFQLCGREQGLVAEAMTDCYVDQLGHLWVTDRALYVSLDPEKDAFTHVAVPPSEYCRSVFQDREGAYWIATSGDGIVRMRASAFRLVTSQDGVPKGSMRSVSVDRNGVVWTGVSTKGLVRHRPRRCRRRDGPLGAGREVDIWSVFAASNGDVWVGTRGPLCVSAPRGDPALSRRCGTPTRSTRTGRAPSGSRRGPPASSNTRTGSSPRCEQSLAPPGANAVAFAEDAQGAFYIGFQQDGIVKLQNGVKTVYNHRNGLPDDQVRAIYPDQEGNLWVGTKRQRPGRLERRSLVQSRCPARAFSRPRHATIVEDHLGNLWLGAPKGVFWGTRKDLLALAKGEVAQANLHLAGDSEGVRAVTIGFGSQPVSSLAPDGSIWFAARPGLLSVQPADLRVNTVAPPVQVDRVTVDGSPVDLTAEIQLAPGTRSLAIDYTAPSFIQPTRITFRYQLVGHDADWVNAGNRRTAYYTNLRPGRYQFRVMAGNEDGVWSPGGLRGGFRPATLVLRDLVVLRAGGRGRRRAGRPGSSAGAPMPCGGKMSGWSRASRSARASSCRPRTTRKPPPGPRAASSRT